MRDGRPDLIAINHDDYSARHVGRLPDGRQFFLTRPFEPPMGGRAGNEFVALFLFVLTAVFWKRGSMSSDIATRWMRIGLARSMSGVCASWGT